MLTEQISKHIKEIKDRYFISDTGILYTNYGEKEMNTCLQQKGYVRNELYLKNNTTKHFFRHRLVMICFNPVENMDRLQVNHIDGNKLNNNLSNLEWVTNDENMQHAKEHNLIARQKGETNPFHKLTEKEVLEIIEMLQEHIPYRQIAEKFNCSKSTISAIKGKRNWSYLTKDIIFN